MIDYTNSELYRNQNRLLIAGSGTMMLAVWSFLKGVLYFTMARTSAMALMGDGLETARISKDLMYGMAAGIVLFILFLDMMLKVYVGSAARAESRGHKRRGVYLFAARIMVIAGACGIFLQIMNLIRWDQANEGLGFGDTLATIVLDAVSLFVTIWLIRSASYIRKARKQAAARR